ncbi:MAG: SatD family protein [Candidatus Polarisedimenticolia bacterium]
MGRHPPTRFVLVGDMIRSRAVAERRAMAKKVETEIRAVNRRWRDAWVAPLTTTRGIDEISGVLREARPAFDIVVFLDTALHPARFRYALASGTVDVAPASTDASAMDGPAFHRAADALAQGRRRNLPFTTAIEGEPPEVRGLVEAAARLHEAIRASWTRREAEAVYAYRLAGTQVAVARKLKVTQQAVSDALARARYADLVVAENAIRAWLDHAGETS